MKTQILSWIATFGLASAGVFAWIKRNKLNIFKYVRIAHDAIDLVDIIVDATHEEADGSIQITPQEVDRLQNALKKLKGDMK